jgi:3-oxoacyl-[acyl-carrier protein] reductase
MNLNAKTVLVTGGAIGIGAAIVRAFADQGSNVVINYNRSESEAEKLAQELRKKKIHVLTVKADVSKEEDIENLFQSALNEFRTIDVLVNNAGYSLGEDFLSGSRQIWLDQFTNNFLSVVSCSQKFVALNKDKKEKKIINISSIYGFSSVGAEGFMQYCASKAAVNDFTQNLAKFVSPILVNAVAPGYVWTPQWYSTDQQSKKDFEEKLVIKRFIKPEEIAEGVVFLAQSEAITGVILPIDGGQTLISRE